MAIKNMTNEELQQWCRDNRACMAARNWIGSVYDLKHAVAECPVPGWLMFLVELAQVADVDDHRLDGMVDYIAFREVYDAANQVYLERQQRGYEARADILYPASEERSSRRIAVNAEHEMKLRALRAQGITRVSHRVMADMLQERGDKLNQVEEWYDRQRAKAEAAYRDIERPALKVWTDACRALIEVED